MSFIPKFICRLNAISTFFKMGIDKLVLQCKWKGTSPGIAKTILRKKKRVQRLTLYLLLLYYYSIQNTVVLAEGNDG